MNSINFRTNYQINRLFLDEKVRVTDNEEVLQPEPEEAPKAPEAKPVTASIDDVLLNFNYGAINRLFLDENVRVTYNEEVLQPEPEEAPKAPDPKQVTASIDAILHLKKDEKSRSYDTSVNNTLEDLKLKGFTQEQIEQYFEQLEGGVYHLKDVAIATTEYGGTLKTFSSIKELASYIGADSRNQLKENGFTDEIIDKYFELKRTGADGAYTYELKFEGDYIINNDYGADGIKTIVIYNDEEGLEIELQIKQDGSCTEKTSKVKFENKTGESSRYAGTVDELLSQGFSESDLKKYFIIEKENNRCFLRKNITYSRQTDKGFETVKITTLDDLKEYCGANERKELKDNGLTDEVIDKYFSKIAERDGKIHYDTAGSLYRISKDGDNVVLTLNDIKSTGSSKCEEVTIKPDGSYTTVKYESSQITDTTKTRHMLSSSGLSDDDIQKYFIEKDGLYTLKENVKINGQVVKTVEQLIDALKR